MKNYFEYQDEKSSKFWEITIEGTTLKTRYGKIGTTGQTTEKVFADEAAVQKEYARLVKEKTGKGYVEVLNVADNAAPHNLKPFDFIKQNPTYGEKFNVIAENINELEQKLGYTVPMFLKEFWLQFGARTYFNHKKKEDLEPNEITCINVYSNHNNLNINVYRLHEFFDGMFEIENMGENFQEGKEYLDACFWVYAVMNDFIDGKSFFEFFYIDALGNIDSFRGEENEEITLKPFINKLVAMKPLFKTFLDGASDVMTNENNPILEVKQTKTTDGKVSNECIIMTLAAVREKYNVNFFPDYYENQLETTTMGVFENNTLFKELEIDSYAKKKKVDGLLFCKNLQAENYIFQEGSDYGPLVVVLGNVIAKNLHLRGSDVFIEGNVVVEQTFIPGDYNHGELTVDGTIQAQLILGTDDHSFEYDPEKIINTIVVGLHQTPKLKQYYLEDVIDEKYLEGNDDGDDDCDETYSVNTKKVIASLKKGEPLLKKKNFDITKIKTANEIQAENEAKYLAGIAQDVQDKIARCKETKDTVLDLRSKKLTELPIEVCDLGFVEELYLDSNEDLQNLPDALVKLKKLKCLSIAYCGFAALPEWITSFTHLEILEFNRNAISELPVGFEKLKNLKEFKASSTKIRSFPAALYDLPKLEVISFAYNHFCRCEINRMLPAIKVLNFSNTWMPEITVPLPTLEELLIDIDTEDPIPKAVFACSNLKILDITNRNEKVTKFPDDLLKLQNLEEISFNLVNISNVLLLKQLPNLTKVSVSFDDFLPASFQDLLQVPQWSAFDYNCDFMSYGEFHEAMWIPILNRKNLERVFRAGSEDDVESKRQYYKVKIRK
jgi:predicted DNA-binding WGR domain protein